MKIKKKPSPEIIQEAKQFANGWVYEIAREYDDSEYVPPSAIIGAWKVDENGSIVGEFLPNPNYKVETVLE